MLAAEELGQLGEAGDGGGGGVEVRRHHQMVKERGKGADERPMVQEEVLRRRRVHGFPRLPRRNHESAGENAILTF